MREGTPKERRLRFEVGCYSTTILNHYPLGSRHAPPGTALPRLRPRPEQPERSGDGEEPVGLWTVVSDISPFRGDDPGKDFVTERDLPILGVVIALVIVILPFA